MCVQADYGENKKNIDEPPKMDNEREASAKWFEGISEMKSMCDALLIEVESLSRVARRVKGSGFSLRADHLPLASFVLPITEGMSSASLCLFMSPFCIAGQMNDEVLKGRRCVWVVSNKLASHYYVALSLQATNDDSTAIWGFKLKAVQMFLLPSIELSFS